MIDYKTFKYWMDSTGNWWVRFPAGFKTIVPATSEDNVKEIIDSIINNHE